jgi:hypothetical protein
MTTWLMDTALFNTLASPKVMGLRNWLEANEASVFLSAASLTEVAASIGEMSGNRWQRRRAAHMVRRDHHPLRRPRPPGRRRDRHAPARYCRAEPVVTCAIGFTTPSLSRRRRSMAMA